MKRHPAYWTFDEWAHRQYGLKLYYFAPTQRHAPPFRRQIRVEAIIDIADDDTLAGIEIISDAMPLPPLSKTNSTDDKSEGV